MKNHHSIFIISVQVLDSWYWHISKSFPIDTDFVVWKIQLLCRWIVVIGFSTCFTGRILCRLCVMLECNWGVIVFLSVLCVVPENAHQPVSFSFLWRKFISIVTNHLVWDRDHKLKGIKVYNENFILEIKA